LVRKHGTLHDQTCVEAYDFGPECWVFVFSLGRRRTCYEFPVLVPSSESVTTPTCLGVWGGRTVGGSGNAGAARASIRGGPCHFAGGCSFSCRETVGVEVETVGGAGLSRFAVFPDSRGRQEAFAKISQNANMFIQGGVRGAGVKSVLGGHGWARSVASLLRSAPPAVTAVKAPPPHPRVFPTYNRPGRRLPQCTHQHTRSLNNASDLNGAFRGLPRASAGASYT
jgi:hypothetical protein